MGCNEVSIYAKLSAPFHLVAFLFLLVGFATASWTDQNGGNNGLFQSCLDTYACFSIDSGTTTDWFRAAIAFTILGFLFALVSLIVDLVYIIAMGPNKLVNLVLIIVDSVAILCVFLAVVIYGAKYHEMATNSMHELGYSFALVCLSFVIHIGGLVCVILDRVIRKRVGQNEIA